MNSMDCEVGTICYSRYAVGKDGRIAYERLRGKACRAVVVPMGEKVWYKKIRLGTESKNRAETEWYIGIWLGPAASSSETLIGTSAESQCHKKVCGNGEWDIQAILDIKGTPQRPGPNKPGLHIPIRIRSTYWK